MDRGDSMKGVVVMAWDGGRAWGSRGQWCLGSVRHELWNYLVGTTLLALPGVGSLSQRSGAAP